MLRDGQFFKEAPPKIGAHYVPQFYTRKTSPEEQFMQDIVLHQARPASLWSRFLGRLLQV